MLVIEEDMLPCVTFLKKNLCTLTQNIHIHTFFSISVFN